MKRRAMTGLIFEAVFDTCTAVVESGLSANALLANLTRENHNNSVDIDARMTRLQDERVCSESRNTR